MSSAVGSTQQLDRQRRLVCGEGQASGAQQALTGDLPTRRHAPERDQQSVLASLRSVSLDDVGQLGLDPAQPQGRQPGAQHLAVQRMGEPNRHPAARRHDVDETRDLERLQQLRSVQPLDVREPEALAHRQQLEQRQPFGLDPGQVLGDQLVERRRGGQRPGQLP